MNSRFPPRALWLATPLLLSTGCGSDEAVDPLPLVTARIEITSSNDTIRAFGATARLVADPLDGAGVSVPGVTVLWTSSDPLIATVNERGFVTAVSNGATEIAATVDQVTAKTPIAVIQTVANVFLSGGRRTILGIGTEIQLGGRAVDSKGRDVVAATISWSSASPEIATVDGNGRVVAVAHGRAAISASSDGNFANTFVDVFSITGTGEASVDSAVVALLQKWGVPGATLAVAVDGRLVAARGYGIANAATGQPTDPSSRVRIASLSKPITAMALMTLLEAGSLSLDQRIFPDILSTFWADSATIVDNRLADITVRQVLTHRGGWNAFQGGVGDPMFQSRSIAAARGVSPPAEIDEVVRYMMTRPLQANPGTAVSYSNFGYSLLARVIEAVTGSKYDDYVQQKVFAPAGITNVVLGGTRESERLADEVSYYARGSEANLVRSVFDDGPGMVQWPYGGFYLTPMDGHGGWVASAIDLVRFGLVVDGQPGVPDIITPATRSLIAANPVSLGGGSYGFGWFVDGSGTWHHTGRLPGSASRLVIGNNGVTYALLLNSSDPNEGSFLGDVVTTLARAIGGVTSWPSGDLFQDY